MACHGNRGKGDGPAAFFNSGLSGARPSDFTVGNYKYRSTESGEFPTDQDLIRVLVQGIPGVMPAFRGLSETDLRKVVAYIKTLASGIENTVEKSVVALPEPQIPSSSTSIGRGREVYMALDCQSCHGVQGDGKGELGKELMDTEGFPTRSPDFRFRSEFRNGSHPQDVLRTLWTGLDGTPMPSYAVQFEGQEADAWHLVNYLLSLSQEK